MDNTELFRTIVNDCADICKKVYGNSAIETGMVLLFKESSLEYLCKYYYSNSSSSNTRLSSFYNYSETKNFIYRLKENILSMSLFNEYVRDYISYHICAIFLKESFCKKIEESDGKIHFVHHDRSLVFLKYEIEKYIDKWKTLASQSFSNSSTSDSNKQQSNIKRIAKKVGSKMGDKMNDEEKMPSQTTTFWQRTKETAWEESKEVFLRQAAKQFRKTAAVPMIQGLKKLGLDNPLVLGLLQSEQGTAVLGAILGLLAPTLPLPAAGKEFAHALSRELRISGGEAVVDPVVNMVMDPIREIFTEQVKMLMPASSDLQLPEKIEEKPKAAPKKRAPRVKKAKTLENADITVKEIKKSKEATT